MPDNNLVEILIRARDDIQGAAQQSKRELQGLKGEAEGLGKSFGLATAAIAAAGAAMFAAVKSTADYGDELLKVSKQTGATVEDLAVLKFAAEQADSSLGDVAMGLKFLADNMTTAINKTGDQRDSFNALGISTDDLKRQQNDIAGLFALVSTRLNEVSSDANKAAIAQNLLGRGAITLRPLMQDLAQQGFGKMRAEAERFGLVISKEMAQAADDFNDNLGRMGAILQGLMNTTLGPVIAMFNDLAIAVGLVKLDATQTSLRALTTTLERLGIEQRNLQNIARSIKPADQKSMLDRVMGTLVGETDPAEIQRQLKATNEAIASLEKTRDQLLNPPQAEQAKTRTGALPAQASKEGEDAAKKFQGAVDSLIKSMQGENNQLQQQILLLKDGETAAARFQMTSKLGLLPPGELTAAQRQQIDGLTQQFLSLTQQLKQAQQEADRTKKILDELTEPLTMPLGKPTQNEINTFITGLREGGRELRKISREMSDQWLTDRDKERIEAQRWGEEIGARIQEIKERFQQDFPEIAALANELLTQIPQAVDARADTIGRDVREIFSGMSEGISALIRGVLHGTQTLGDAAGRVIQGIGLGIADKILKRAFQPIEDALADITTNLIRSGINLLAGAFTGGLAGGGVQAGRDGTVFPGPFMPFRRYQHGGIASGPQLGFIGEGGPEAVIPLKQGAVPVEMSGSQPLNVTVVLKNPIDPAVFRTTKEEMVSVFVNDYRSDGATRRVITQH